MPRLTDRTITMLMPSSPSWSACAPSATPSTTSRMNRTGRCVAAAIPGGLNVAISQSAPAPRLAVEDVPAVGEALMRTAAALAVELDVHDVQGFRAAVER